jgi:hypothetical protein
MKRFPMLAVIVALMLMAAACSSSDDSGDEAAAVTTAEDGNAGDGGDTTDTGDEEGDTADTGDEGDAGDDGDLGGLGILSDEDCFQAAQAMAAAFSGGIGQTFEPGDIADAFDQLGAVAPSEIADDLSFIGDTLSGFYNELEAAGVDFDDPNAFADPAIAGAIVEAGESLDTEEFNEALDNVDAWFAENCDSS